MQSDKCNSYFYPTTNSTSTTLLNNNIQVFVYNYLNTYII